MNVSIDPFGWGPLWLLGFGVALLSLLLVAGRALTIVPQRRTRREFVARLAPVVGLVAVLSYLVFATRELFGSHPDSLPFALALLLFGFGAAAWPAIRDLVAGVFIKAGRLCQVGDHVQVGTIRGRVARMGYRVLSIETGQGEEAILRYSELSRRSLLRTPIVEGAALHVFRVALPEDVPEQEAMRRVRQSALACHWASAVRAPNIALLSPRTLEVVVYALDAEHAPDVEAAVRKALRPMLEPSARALDSAPPSASR